MNYWIFKASPERYRLDDRLADPSPEITWTVTRYRTQIHAGDLAFIWRAGTPRGICATMVIETDPLVMEKIESEKRYSLSPRVRKFAYRVRGKLVDRFPLIDSRLLKQIPGLYGLSVFHGYQQTTNFSVTQQEGEILLAIIEGTK